MEDAVHPSLIGKTGKHAAALLLAAHSDCLQPAATTITRTAATASPGSPDQRANPLRATWSRWIPCPRRQNLRQHHRDRDSRDHRLCPALQLLGLWSSANIPSILILRRSSRWTSRNCNISVMVNGAPVQATVVDPPTHADHGEHHRGPRSQSIHADDYRSSPATLRARLQL